MGTVNSPVIKSERDAVLAFHGLDPRSQHPKCDWCSKKTDGCSAHGCWWMHVECAEKAKKWHLGSLELPAVEWAESNEAPVALVCELGRRRPPALTTDQLAEIVAYNRAGYLQREIAQQLGIKQERVSRGLKKAKRLNIKPAPITLYEEWEGVA